MNKELDIVSKAKDILLQNKDSPYWVGFKESIFFKPCQRKITFESLYDLLQFAESSYASWLNIYDDSPKKLKNSIDYFNVLMFGVSESVVLQDDEYRNRLPQNLGWNKDVKGMLGEVNIFLPDSKEVGLILDLEKENKKYVNGAIDFFLGNGPQEGVEHAIGYNMAYEIATKEYKSLKSARFPEKEEVESLISKTQELFNLTQNHLNKLLNEDIAKFHEFVRESKDEKEALKKSYEETLKFSEPREHWEERSESLKKEAWRSFVGLVIVVIVGMAVLFLVLTGDVVPELYGGGVSGVKASIVLIVLMSVWAYAIKIIAKTMFSSFHLARDAEERAYLTGYYLSLLRQSAIGDSQKDLITQSLFSRSDTGLLKDDGGVTMPSDFIKKGVNN